MMHDFDEKSFQYLACCSINGRIISLTHVHSPLFGLVVVDTALNSVGARTNVPSTFLDIEVSSKTASSTTISLSSPLRNILLFMNERRPYSSVFCWSFLLRRAGWVRRDIIVVIFNWLVGCKNEADFPTKLETRMIDMYNNPPIL